MEDHTNEEILTTEEPSALQGNLITQVRLEIAVLEKRLAQLKEYLKQSEYISQMLRGVMGSPRVRRPRRLWTLDDAEQLKQLRILGLNGAEISAQMNFSTSFISKKIKEQKAAMTGN